MKKIAVLAVVLGLVLGLVSGPASGRPRPRRRSPRRSSSSSTGSAGPRRSRSSARSPTRIWEYAELGLQEFESSKLLADTLEAAGFTVERGLAGMPTCFVASYGSGKPVIGLLGEFDALPMLSQKGRVAEEGPGRRGRARPRLRPQRHVHGRRGRRHRRQGGHGRPRHQGDDQGLRLAGRGDRGQPALHDPGRPVRGRRRRHRQPQLERLRHRTTASAATPSSRRSSPSRARRPTRPARPGSGGAPSTPSRS